MEERRRRENRGVTRRASSNRGRYRASSRNREKVLATIAAFAVAGGIAIGVSGGGRETEVPQEPETSVSTQVEIPVSEIEEQIETTGNMIDGLKDKDAVLRYLKEEYVKQYNEAHGTDIKSYEVKFRCSNHTYVYEVEADGTKGYVTHGDYPDITAKKLRQNGYSTDDKVGDVMVYSSSRDGKTMECFAMKGGIISPCTSGNNYVAGEKIDFANNTLANYSRVIYTGIDYALEVEKGDSYGMYVKKPAFEKAIDSFEASKENVEKEDKNFDDFER